MDLFVKFANATSPHFFCLFYKKYCRLAIATMAAAAGPMEVPAAIGVLAIGPPKPICGISHTNKGVWSMTLVIPTGRCYLTTTGNHPIFCSKNVTGSRSIVTRILWGAVVGLATDAAGDVGVMIKDDDGKKTVYLLPRSFSGCSSQKERLARYHPARHTLNCFCSPLATLVYQ